jgi:hypothetical protein
LRRAGLPTGRYKVQISDGADRWAATTLELGPSTGEIAIQIHVVTVRGQAFWGANALKAQLALGGRFAERRIVVATDDEGRFEAQVPEELAATAKWTVAVYSEEAGNWSLLALRPSSCHRDYSHGAPTTAEGDRLLRRSTRRLLPGTVKDRPTHDQSSPVRPAGGATGWGGRALGLLP